MAVVRKNSSGGTNTFRNHQERQKSVVDLPTPSDRRVPDSQTSAAPENSGKWELPSDKWGSERYSKEMIELCELWWALGCNFFSQDYLQVKRSDFIEKFKNKIDSDKFFWTQVDKRGRAFGQEMLINLVEHFWHETEDGVSWTDPHSLRFFGEKWDELMYLAELNISTKHLVDNPNVIRRPVQDYMARLEEIGKKRAQEEAQKAAELEARQAELDDGPVVEETYTPRRLKDAEGLKSKLAEIRARREAQQQLSSEDLQGRERL